MKFINVNGVIQRARRYANRAGGVQDEEVKDPVKLAELIRQLQKRVADLEAVSPPEGIEFEVNCGSGGAATRLFHSMGGPVRFYLTHWQPLTGGFLTAGPELIADPATSTADMLVLNSYVAGRAIIRVERSQSGLTG